MICVIIGHMVYCNLYGEWTYKLFEFIYAFHMPAFVLISGYCYKDKPLKRGGQDILNLLLVFVVFQILYCGDLISLRSIRPFTYEGLRLNITHFYEPSSVLWYIVALSVWRVFMIIIPRGWRNIRLLIVSILVSLLAGFVPLGFEFSFQRIFAFFPYFLLGFLIKENNGFDKIRSFNHWICTAVLIIYICFLVWGPALPRCIFTERSHYYEGMTSLYRILFYVISLPTTICILNLVPDNKFLAKEGQNTMSYYIYHPYIIYLFMYLTGTGLGVIPSTVPFIFLYSFVCLIICYVIARISILNFLVNPLKFKWYSNKNELKLDEEGK